MTTRERARRPGLSSKGNRILLSVVVGWVAWFCAGLFDAPSAARLVLLAIVAAVTYAMITPRA
ncbi:MAG TPA: hypothetical protein VIP77_16165 [Jiangellaceae bacterium]